MPSYNIIDKYYDEYLIHNKEYWDVGINEKFLYLSDLEKLSKVEEISDAVCNISLNMIDDSYLVIEYVNVDNLIKHKEIELPKLILDVDGEKIEISKKYFMKDNAIIIKYLARGKSGRYNKERKINYLLDEKIITKILEDNGFSEIKKVEYTNAHFEYGNFYINYIRAKKLNPLLKATPEYEEYDKNYIKSSESCCSKNKCGGCKKINKKMLKVY